MPYMLSQSQAKIGTAICLLFIFFAYTGIAAGCPFCSALAPTLQQEFAKMDHVGIAICTQSAGKAADNPIHTFRFTNLLGNSGQGSAESEILSGDLRVFSNQAIRVGDKVILFGVGDQKEIDWAPSVPLSPLALKYVLRQFELCSADQSRSDHSESAWFELYWTSLESKDEWVRRDAYNAVATYSIQQLTQLCQHLTPKEIRSRISHKMTSTSHRRFYWSVLGLRGDKEDLQFVRELIERQLEVRADRPLALDLIGLDAAVSSYLLLGGEDALQDVEENILENPKRHRSERFAAVSALRIHAEEFQVLEKKRICKALALLLKSPDADAIIPDLARLEDWSHTSTLTKLFREAKQSDQPFVLVPIINYLRACPYEEGKMALAECRRIDPDAYLRASRLFRSSRKADDGLNSSPDK